MFEFASLRKILTLTSHERLSARFKLVRPRQISYELRRRKRKSNSTDDDRLSNFERWRVRNFSVVLSRLRKRQIWLPTWKFVKIWIIYPITTKQKSFIGKFVNTPKNSKTSRWCWTHRAAEGDSKCRTGSAHFYSPPPWALLNKWIILQNGRLEFRRHVGSVCSGRTAGGSPPSSSSSPAAGCCLLSSFFPFFARAFAKCGNSAPKTY